MRHRKVICFFLSIFIFMFSSKVCSMLNFLRNNLNNKTRFQFKKTQKVFYTEEVGGKKKQKKSSGKSKTSSKTDNVKESAKKAFLGAVGGGTVYVSNEIKKYLEKKETWLEQIKEWWYSIYLSEKEQDAIKEIMTVLKPGPIKDDAWFEKIADIFEKYQLSSSSAVRKKLDDIRNLIAKIVKKTSDDIQKIDLWERKKDIAQLDENGKKQFIDVLESMKNRYEKQIAISKKIGVYVGQEDYNAVLNTINVLTQ